MNIVHLQKKNAFGVHCSYYYQSSRKLAALNFGRLCQNDREPRKIRADFKTKRDAQKDRPDFTALFSFRKYWPRKSTRP